MEYKLVLVGVDKEPTNEVEGDAWEPSHKDVAEILSERTVDWDFDTGWLVKSIEAPHWDVETLADVVRQANLSSENTISLLGRITGDSVQRGIEAWSAKIKDA